MKPSSENGPKLIQFEREGWRDTVAALRAIADQIESGEQSRPKVGVLVLHGSDNRIETFGFGSKADDLSALGLLRVGEQIIVNGQLSSQ